MKNYHHHHPRYLQRDQNPLPHYLQNVRIGPVFWRTAHAILEEFRTGVPISYQLPPFCPVNPMFQGSLQGGNGGCHTILFFVEPPFAHNCFEQECEEMKKMQRNSFTAPVDRIPDCCFGYLLPHLELSEMQQIKGGGLKCCKDNSHHNTFFLKKTPQNGTRKS